MNSMSRNQYYQRDNCRPCNPCKPCDPCNPCKPCDPCNFQSCGCANIGPLPVTITSPLVPQVLNYPIAEVSDEGNLNCHCFKINFLGNLTVTSTVAPTTVTLNFTLYKSCTGNGFRQPIGFFTATASIAVPNTTQNQNITFEGTTCRCRSERNCNYILELTSVSSTVASTLNISIFGILCIKGLNNSCGC